MIDALRQSMRRSSDTYYRPEATLVFMVLNLGRVLSPTPQSSDRPYRLYDCRDSSDHVRSAKTDAANHVGA